MKKQTKSTLMVTLYGGDKMEKVYSRINWENYPSTVSPINEVNLNKIDTALDTTDTRIVTFDTTKANQTDLLLCVESISYNSTTGVFLFTWQNGTTLSVDLNIEKIPVSFTMSEAGVITMTNADGTTYTCDVGALIHQYNFIDSDQLDFTATLQEDGSYSVTAIIKAGSITDAMLEPTYLSTIQAYVASALASATSSRSYAVGGTASRTGEDTDNSKYYKEQAQAYKEFVENAIDLNIPTFTVDFATGDLIYDGGIFVFTINNTTGNLEYEVA